VLFVAPEPAVQEFEEGSPFASAVRFKNWRHRLGGSMHTVEGNRRVKMVHEVTVTSIPKNRGLLMYVY
jgi:hypothetical protein